MKILVPCDFSKISNNAALYAAKFAKKIKGEIVLLNVAHYKHPPHAQVGMREREIEALMLAGATKECNLLVDKLKSMVKGIRISSKVVRGYPIESIINDSVKSNKIDLIIMGTKGASGLKKTIFGSNAVNVINRTSIPVITVPEFARFNQMKHIVYASDTSDVSKTQPGIQKLITLAEAFNASLHFFHVLPQDSDKKIEVSKIKASLTDRYHYKKISFHVSHQNDLVEAISDFVADKNTDLLAMLTHDITFFENVFNTSLSREMAFRSLVPLLTIKK